MVRKLKVYQAQFGFFDTVVAAPSQAAALKAWGSERNLFAGGGARVATDERAIAAALDHPEVPLRRAVGSDDPFSLNPRLPRFPELPEGTKPKTAATATRKAPAKAVRRDPPPDRSRLEKAEATLAALERARAGEEASFRDQRATLERAERAAADAFDLEHERARAAVAKERQAYLKAGGRS